MASGTDVFLSHDWGNDESGRDNHQGVSLINQELKERGYLTWFDEEKIKGNIVDKMCKGIEQTKVVITFITKRYMEKVYGDHAGDNCKLEFNYASRQKTSSKMVAVVMEKSMLNPNNWTGPVGFHLGGEFYVDMSGNLENRTYLSEKMGDLQEQLQSKGIQLLPGTFLLFRTMTEKTTVFR